MNTTDAHEPGVFSEAFNFFNLQADLLGVQSDKYTPAQTAALVRWFRSLAGWYDWLDRECQIPTEETGTGGTVITYLAMDQVAGLVFCDVLDMLDGAKPITALPICGDFEGQHPVLPVVFAYAWSLNANARHYFRWVLQQLARTAYTRAMPEPPAEITELDLGPLLLARAGIAKAPAQPHAEPAAAPAEQPDPVAAMLADADLQRRALLACIQDPDQVRGPLATLAKDPAIAAALGAALLGSSLETFPSDEAAVDNVVPIPTSGGSR